MLRKRKSRAGRKHHSTTRKVAIARKICASYATAEFTLESCCAAAGIHINTFEIWRDQIVEIGKDFKRASREKDRRFMGRLKARATTSLEKLVTGFTEDEVTREAEIGADGKQKNAKVKTTKRIFPPNPTAVLFSLKNADSGNFKDRVATEISGPDGAPIETQTTVKGKIDYSAVQSIAESLVGLPGRNGHTESLDTVEAGAETGRVPDAAG